MRASIIICVVLLLGLAGCKMDIRAELFTADIRDAVEGKPATAEINIAFQVTSQEDCDKIEKDVVGIFQREYGSAQFAGCPKKQFIQMGVIRVSAPIQIVNANAGTDKPVAIGVIRDNPERRIVFLVNRGAMNRMMSLLPEEMRSMARFMDKGDREFSASISNDERNVAKIIVEHAFVNDKPTIEAREISLRRRQAIKIALSNVANQALNGTANEALIAKWRTQ